MFDKLEELEKKYEELTKLISDPEIIADQNTWRKYMKEQSAMKDVVDKYIEYEITIKADICTYENNNFYEISFDANNMEEAKEMMSDPEMKDMAEEEYYSSKEKLPSLEEELKILLLPKDENDDSNVIIEIRGGAGGEEAALFAYNLYRMYTMYAETKHWKVEVLNWWS